MKFFSTFVIVFLFSINLLGQVVLTADGPGNTYELITSVFAPDETPLEPPDCSHPEFGRHIDEVWDSVLNEYVFRFYIHVTPDDDRCLYTDRQRNEIKIYNPSPSILKGFLGDSLVYQWRFKLDSGFQTSSSFTHIHQLKGVGGDQINMPLITFTPRKGNPDRLQLRYAETTSQTTLAAFDLNLFKGKWVSVTECVRYNEEGSYSVTFTDYLTGEELAHYENNGLRMWRTGASYFRPKWGIYRSLAHAEDLRDEEVLFNEFKINKVSATSVSNELIGKTVEVFPVPADQLIHIRSENIENLTVVKLVDLSGKEYPIRLNSKNLTIDISGLPSGVYLIELATPEVKIFKKIIKR
jgi:hypothetical protein